MERSDQMLDFHADVRTPREATESRFGGELLTVHDAARLLNVTVSWVYEHTRDDAEDRLPFVKLGKCVGFVRTDLLEYVDAKARRLATERDDVDTPACSGTLKPQKARRATP